MDLSRFEHFKAFWREKADLAETEEERAECLAHLRSLEEMMDSVTRSQGLIAESRALLQRD